MTLQAASRFGLEVVIGERFADSPAARLTSRSVVFHDGWDDRAALDELARQATVVTVENEFVDWRVLQSLEERDARVWPSPNCVRVVQDKLLQKRALARAELPVPRFREVSDPSELQRTGAELGWPLMLKARRDGYDGRGNLVVHHGEEAEQAFLKLGWPERALFAEEFIAFDRELACLAVRGQDRQVVNYPVVETRQDPKLHICREVLAPATLPDQTARKAADVARAAVEAVDGIGAFGVELFELPNDEIVINELAPRPHNSAHYTIEACWTSQFENHVRAVLGWPLGDPGMRAPAAAMVNLLGTSEQPPQIEGLGAEHAYVHLYGKTENREGRKMGHVTAIGDTTDEALARAHETASRIRV